MIHIEYQLVEENKGRVTLQVYTPEILTKERLAAGVQVEEIPTADTNLGVPTLYVNPKTKEMWYEYSAFPEQPLYANTDAGRLQKQVDDLKLLLAEMISGGTVQ